MKTESCSHFRKNLTEGTPQSQVLMMVGHLQDGGDTEKPGTVFSLLVGLEMEPGALHMSYERSDTELSTPVSSGF